MLNRRRVSISMSFCSTFLSFSAWELHSQNEQNAYYAVCSGKIWFWLQTPPLCKEWLSLIRITALSPGTVHTFHSRRSFLQFNALNRRNSFRTPHLEAFIPKPHPFKLVLLLWSIRQPLHNILSPCHVETGHRNFHNPPLEVLVVRCKKIYLALAHSVRDAIIRICTSDHSRFSSIFHRFQDVVQFDTEGQALLIQLERRTWSSECMTHRGYPLRFRAVAIYF